MKKGSKHTKETRLKMSRTHKNIPNESGRFKAGNIPWIKGRIGIFKHSTETKIKMSEDRKKAGCGKWNKGKKQNLTSEQRKKISIRMLGNNLRKGIKHSDEWKEKMRLVFKGRKCKPRTEEQKMKISLMLKGKHLSPKTEFKKGHIAVSGSEHPHWNPNRELVRMARRDDLNAGYRLWVRRVKKRDNYKCKINNEDCEGYSEAHHILPWSKYPELRYEVNNGITLCHFHHPRKRDEEIKLAPVFQKMVSMIAN